MHVLSFAMADSSDVFKMLSLDEDKLEGLDNYPMWAYMMQHVLVSKGLFNIVNGTNVRLDFGDTRSIEDVAVIRRFAAESSVLLTTAQAC